MASSCVSLQRGGGEGGSVKSEKSEGEGCWWMGGLDGCSELGVDYQLEGRVDTCD